MRWFASVSFLAVLAFPAAAQHIPVPVMSDDEITSQMNVGAELETRLDGDLNGDGEIDTVTIERSDEQRTMRVFVAYREETDLGHDPVATLELDPYPLGPAGLEIKNGVLVIDDLTGGTTATSATYRYRYDAKKKSMRLIGLDGKFYSRTNAHGWSSFSWNLLNGDYVTETAKLLYNPTSDEAYGAPVSKKTKKSSAPIYMEQTPSPEGMLTE